MRLGARWRVGEAPHRGVPPTLYDAIGTAESRFPDSHSWTLTWLEGRPVVALDSVLSICLSTTGQIIEKVFTPETGLTDTGKSALHPAGSGGLLPATQDTTHGDNDDDDDDDWLIGDA